MILDYDKRSLAEQADFVAEKGVPLAGFFIKALDAIRAKETTEYLIVLIDKSFEVDLTRSLHFHRLNTADSKSSTDSSNPSSSVDIYEPFLRILSSGIVYHPFVLNRTAHILSILLSTGDESVPAMSTFLRYVIAKLNSQHSSSREQIAALSSLKPLLSRPKTQLQFAEHQGLLALVSILNKDSQNAQLIYSVGFNLWLISYNKQLTQQFTQYQVIKKLVGILKVHVMEKVIRICFAILRNVIDHNLDPLNEEMIGLSLLPVIETLQKRKFKDADIAPDMLVIQEKLTETITRLSTFDMYSTEVTTGNLNWSPAHKNEIFWRENIAKFEEGNFRLVAQLIKCLADKEDLVSEVACYDLGEFARFHPDGKRVIQKLGGKAKLMANLQHKNPKVAKAALLATQKLMVANWEFLAKSSAGGVAALVSKSK